MRVKGVFLHCPSLVDIDLSGKGENSVFVKIIDGDVELT